MSCPPDPIHTREQDGGADDQTRPVHVVNGRRRHGHVQWRQVHGDDQERPTHADHVDQISPAAQVEVRTRGEDFATTNQDLVTNKQERWKISMAREQYLVCGRDCRKKIRTTITGVTYPICNVTPPPEMMDSKAKSLPRTIKPGKGRKVSTAPCLVCTLGKYQGHPYL